MSTNGRFLRHRFSPKPTNVATPNSLPKRIHVAKEAVSTALQTNSRQRSERPWQTKRCAKDEAVALRKNHVVRRNLRMTFAICYRPHAPATASDDDTSNCQPRSIASEFVHRETVTRVGSCTLPVPMRYPCVSCNASRNRAKQKRDGNSKPVPNANLFGDNVARTRRFIRVGLHG